MDLVIASDHAGFEMKKVLIEYLQQMEHHVKDLGSYVPDSVDYPDFAHPLAEAVEKGLYRFGISLCGSGNGINITVNKHQGIRAALCWNTEIAELARKHNNANIISLPARFISEQDAKDIVNIFLNTEFEGGRHERRINKIPCKN
jgi:ribose 5-phosphate isomerase B